MFLHNNHYRYIKKVQRTPDASNLEKPNRPSREEIQDYFKNKSRPKQPAPMNDQLKELAAEREKRMQGPVCKKGGLALTEDFEKLMLESDEEMARRLNDEEERRREILESDKEFARQLYEKERKLAGGFGLSSSS